MLVLSPLRVQHRRFLPCVSPKAIRVPELETDEPQVPILVIGRQLLKRLISLTCMDTCACVYTKRSLGCGKGAVPVGKDATGDVQLSRTHVDAHACSGFGFMSYLVPQGHTI